MKRIERPPQILYVERQIALGLVCLYLAATGVALFLFIPGIRIVWVGALGFGAVGLVYLFHRRVLGIDRERGILVVLQEGLFQSKARATFEIKELEVWLISRPRQPPGPAVVPQDVHEGWIVRNGQPILQLRQGVDLGLVQELSEGVARDLGRPIQLIRASASSE